MEFIKGLSRSIGMRLVPLVVMVAVMYFFKDVSLETSVGALKNYLIFSIIVVVISVTLGLIIKTSSKKVKAMVEKQKARPTVIEESKNTKETTTISFKIDLYMITIVVLTGLFVTNIISLENIVFALFALEGFLLFVILFTSTVAFVGLSLTVKNLKRL